MIDYAPIQARGKREAPTASREGAQAVAKALNASPPSTADGVDKLYYQLVEIHAIIAKQLVECIRWRRSDSTPNPVWARIDRQRLNKMPSATRTTPLSPTDFSPQASLR
jgi:hypothetical protein